MRIWLKNDRSTIHIFNDINLSHLIVMATPRRALSLKFFFFYKYYYLIPHSTIREVSRRMQTVHEVGCLDWKYLFVAYKSISNCYHLFTNRDTFQNCWPLFIPGPIVAVLCLWLESFKSRWIIDPLQWSRAAILSSFLCWSECHVPSSIYYTSFVIAW